MAPVEPATPAPSNPGWAPGATSQPAPAAEAPAAGSGGYQIPSWAPRIPVPGSGSQTSGKQWFRDEPHATHRPSQVIPPQPTPPVTATPAPGAGVLPVAQVPPLIQPAGGQPAGGQTAGGQPAQPQPQPGPAQSRPAAAQPQQAPAQPAAAKASWQVVEQQVKAEREAPVATAEDRSYAEWFAWAKRGGAPASACHAAAQGAFAALTGGKDLATAVQWATAAMSRPPGDVSAARQTYCAWFSLANIDLNLDQPRSHAFATAAAQALDAGADAAAAHAAGLAAAGVR